MYHSHCCILSAIYIYLRLGQVELRTSKKSKFGFTINYQLKNNIYYQNPDLASYTHNQGFLPLAITGIDDQSVRVA